MQRAFEKAVLHGDGGAELQVGAVERRGEPAEFATSAHCCAPFVWPSFVFGWLGCLPEVSGVQPSNDSAKAVW